MALLEVRRPGQRDPERVRVTRKKPVSVGNHAAVDIAIEAADVPSLLCRIAWNGEVFEAIAADQDDLTINGERVRQREMADGDTLEAGGVLITMHRGAALQRRREEKKRRRESTTPPPREPLEEDVDPVTLSAFQLLPDGHDLFEDEEDTDLRRVAAAHASRQRDGDRPADAEPAAANGANGAAGFEDAGHADADREGDSEGDGEELGEDDGAAGEEDEPVDLTLTSDAVPIMARREDEPALSETERAERADQVAARNKLRQKIRAKAVRPGERDPIRSPLLQGLAALIVVLVFASIVFALVLRQRSVQEQFDIAAAAYSSGRYADAIEKFETFLQKHPTSPLAEEARRKLALSQVDRLVRAAAPEWDEALGGLRGFVDRARDDDDFDTLYQGIAERAGTIALGAAADAGTRRQPALLGVSKDAEETLVAFSPESNPPEKLIRQVDEARRKSRRQLQTYDVLDASVTAMAAAADQGRPLDVLRQYRDMVAAEPTLARNRETRDRHAAAIAALQTGVADWDAAGWTPPELPPLRWTTIGTAAVLERPPGREQQSGGLIAGVWTDGTLFGVDTGSGDPLWRVSLGPRFEPVEVSDPQPGWVGQSLAGDGLVYIDRNGQEVSRIPLPAAPLRPTASGTSLLVPMEPGDGSGLLARVNLQSGAISTAARLPQPLLPQPAVVDGSVVLFGSREVVYLLEETTLALQSLFELGHAAGSLQAAPISAARLVVAALNEPRRGRLVLLEVQGEAGQGDAGSGGAGSGGAGSGGVGRTLAQVDQTPIDGRVVDVLQLRGRDLFVASSGGRATVLSVNDEGGGSIERGPTFVGGSRSDGLGSEVPTFLQPGSDRQFWMIGERMRRLRTTADSIRPVGRTLSLGLPTQSPVRIGDSLLVCSQPSLGRATRVGLFDGDQLGRAWLLHLGDSLRAVADHPAGPIAVTDAGFSVRLREGFVISASDRLPGPVAAAIALPDGGLAAVGDATVDLDLPADEPPPDAAPDAVPEATPEPEPANPFRAAGTDGGTNRETDRGRDRPTYPVMLQRAAATKPGMLTLVSSSGRVSRKVPLPGVPEQPPLLWREGLVVLPPGRLRWVPLARAASPPDIWLTQGGDAPPAWRSVVAVDDTRLLALTADGVLRQLLWQDEQIVETDQATVEGLAMLAGPLGGGVVIGSDGRSLVRIDAATLDRQPLVSPLVRVDSLHAVGDQVFAAGVDADAQRQVVAAYAEAVEPVAEAGPVLGVLEHAGAIVLTTPDALIEIDGPTRTLPSPASVGAIVVGDRLAVPLRDGALIIGE